MARKFPTQSFPIGLQSPAIGIKRRLLSAEISDSDGVALEPTLDLKSWDGDCHLRIDLRERSQAALSIADNIPAISVLNDKPRLEALGSKIGLRLYYQKKTVVIPDPGCDPDWHEESRDGLEWEILLGSKPSSNVFEFPIETQGLKFYYQPDLEQWELDLGAYRPDDVVGSYAVYHASRRDNLRKADGTVEEYKTGKAFHIYRPEAIDAEGRRIWCDLHIDPDAGILRITVPRQFLNTAVYPIIIDPTFGNSSVQSTLLTMSNYAWGQRGTLGGTDGTADTVHGYGRQANGAGTMYGAIYDDSSGPNNLEESESTGTATGGAVQQWYDCTMPGSATLLASTNYFATVRTDNFRAKYDSTGGTSFYNTGYTFPDPMTTEANQTWLISVYCTYTEAAGDVTVGPFVLSAGASVIAPTVVLGSISITPAVMGSTAYLIAPSVIHGSISLGGFTLSAAASMIAPGIILGSVSVSPAEMTASAEMIAPAVVQSSMTVGPFVLSASGSMIAPSVIHGSLSLGGFVLSASGSMIAPTVILGSISISPAEMTATAIMPDPTVDAGGNVTVGPFVLSASASIISPAVILGSLSISPAEMTAGASLIAPTIVLGSLSISPAEMTATAYMTAPSVVLGSISLSPAAMIASAEMPNPTVQAGGNIAVSPAEMIASASMIAPTIVLGSTSASPDPMISSASLISPVVILGSLSLAPTAMISSASIVAPAVILGSISITPGEMTAGASLISPSIILGSMSVSPAPMTASAEMHIGSITGLAYDVILIIESRITSPSISGSRITHPVAINSRITRPTIEDPTLR